MGRKNDQHNPALKKDPKTGIITIGLLFKNESKKMQTRAKVLLILTTVLGIVLLSVIWLFKCNITSSRFQCGGVEEEPNNTQAVADILGQSVSREKAIWWDGEFAYARNIKVTNTSPLEALTEDSYINATFDHQNLVNLDKSTVDGKDLHLVYFKNGEFVEIPFKLTSPNTTDTDITFKIAEKIDPLASDEFYCLYYGNPFEINAEESDIVANLSSIKYEAEFDSERLNPIQSKTNRLWILKGTDDYSMLNLEMSVNDPEIDVESADFEIVGEQLKGELRRTSNSQYIADIDMETLTPGTYQIKSFVTTSNDVQMESAIHEFIVSYPLYVTWSIDWEGVDTSDSTLTAMENFSTKYETPIIQLWNPRAHIALGRGRLTRLLDWIKNRNAQGDEIGLHLHMFTDMVAAAGVTPQNTPNWAAERNKSGSDTPAYVYNYDEHVKMFEWAKSEFAKEGLDTPKVFRAGGWMSNMDQLKALDDTGFVIDTSGRTKFSLGEYKVKVTDETNNTNSIRRATNEEINQYLAFKADPTIDQGTLPYFVEYKVEGLWDLDPTDRPYQISTTNINTTGPSKLDLWEFQNNGIESWRYDTAALKERFKANFYGEPLEEMQVLTYLTHPHSIAVDMKKMYPLYDDINQFTAKSDTGPVIYSTFEEPYKYITGESY